MAGALLLHGATILGAGEASAGDGSGWVVVEGDRIAARGHGATPAADNAVNLDGMYLCPGFIDQHCHGGGGFHFSEGPQQARSAAALHLAHGTTSLVASVVSQSAAVLAAQVQMLAPLVHDHTFVGLHLEGPWISHHRHGAHDVEVLRTPDRSELATLLRLGGGTIAMVTLAPELAGAFDAIDDLVAAGVVVAIGHTSADDITTHRAIDAGARVATHLFNAMPALKHREPGPIGALLRDPRVAVELIADCVHVHPDVLAVVASAAGPARTTLITDAMAAAGSADGEYTLGALDVTVVGGEARVRLSGALAGSTLTLDAALRNVVQRAGWNLSDAVDSLTAVPARTLGLLDRGRIAVDQRADLVVLDEQLTVRAVMRDGTWTTPNPDAPRGLRKVTETL